MNVVGIHLPPLRERPEDIPLLVEHFIRKYNFELGKHYQGVTEEAQDMLVTHEWKGNIRELENVIERAVIFAEDDWIDVCDIGLMGPVVTPLGTQGDNLQVGIKAFERQHITRVLNKFAWNKALAAEALDVGLSSLYRKMDDLGIKTRKQKHGA